MSEPERLRRATRSSLAPDACQLFDEFAQIERAGSGPAAFPIVGHDGALDGPFNAMLLSPPLGRAMQGLGASIRHHSDLSDRMRELAILAIAADERAPFIAYGHEAVGRGLGLSEAEMAAIAAERSPALADAREAAALTVVKALLDVGTLDDREYDAATQALGERTTFELTVVVGYYRMLALQLRLFRVAVPAA